MHMPFHYCPLRPGLLRFRQSQHQICRANLLCRVMIFVVHQLPSSCMLVFLARIVGGYPWFNWNTSVTALSSLRFMIAVAASFGSTWPKPRLWHFASGPFASDASLLGYAFAYLYWQPSFSRGERLCRLRAASCSACADVGDGMLHAARLGGASPAPHRLVGAGQGLSEPST